MQAYFILFSKSSVSDHNYRLLFIRLNYLYNLTQYIVVVSMITITILKKLELTAILIWIG